MRVGYTTGIFDLFHIGHLKLLQKAKAHCDRLIVGVSTDELACKLKGKPAIIPFEERIEIVKNIVCVDSVVTESEDNKLAAWNVLKFNIIFKGDDWKGSDKWNVLEGQFRKLGVKVSFLPYTKTTSSSIIRKICEGL